MALRDASDPTPAAHGDAQGEFLSAAQRPVVERLGLRYFRRLSRSLPPAAQNEQIDAIYYLNPQERRALNQITRRAVLRSGLAGGLSGLATAIAEIWTVAGLGAASASEEPVVFWAIVGGVTLVATALEIGFLYWDALRSVHRLAWSAGMDLFPNGHDGDAIASALVRAALELPNPKEQMFGVDPQREVSRLWLIAATLIYKVKIGVTNFLTKLLVRRLLGRGAVRFALPLLAVPVTTAWNAIVTWRVLREARLRVMGPSAAVDYVAAIIPKPTALSASGRINMVRAVASSVVRTHDMHPNHAALLEVVTSHVGATTLADHELDNYRTFLEEVRSLPDDERGMALRLFAVAAVIDGRLHPGEIQLLRQAHTACGTALDRPALTELFRNFTAGNVVDRGVLERLGRSETLAMLELA